MNRLLKVEDVPRMAPLGQDFFTYAKLPGTFNIERFLGVWSRMIADNTALVVGHFDASDVLRGAAGAYITPDTMTTDVVAFEAFFWISPGFRGKGVSLMKDLEFCVKDAGAKRLWMVHLEDENAPAMRRYYERQGYQLHEFLYLKNL